MNEIISNLKAFNRKERYFLVGAALGKHGFRLSDNFKGQVESTFDIKVPEDNFVAMDYHLDWIYASLTLSKYGEERKYPNIENIIHASCEDIDLLIAYELKDTYHIIFLEAKGVTLFSNKQLQSKIKRLAEIFGKEGELWPGVVAHFAIVSPKEPQRIKHDNWPAWAKPGGKVKWMQLNIANGLKKVVRCNESDIPDKNGNYWMVKPGEY
ncbi:hypothetical protein ACFLYI_01185 [Chloroflexota bacterium]